MKWTLLFLFFALALADECNLDANDLEWHVTFVGREYSSESDATTFTYTLYTDVNNGGCTGTNGNCQSLSHWVIINDCANAQGSPAGAGYGKDGQMTIDGVSVVGYKWETSNTVGNTLTFTLTVSGNEPLSTVQYLVKGATRCGSGSIAGPSCDGDQTPPPPPPPVDEDDDEPECSVATDCPEDDVACTVRACEAGVCVQRPDNGECVVAGSCVVYECNPSASGADSEGCVQVDLDDSVCAEAATCTNNFCDPSDERADSRNCVVQHLDDRCSDEFSCTLNVCDPDASDADVVSGCTITYQDSECQDGATCSDNVCSPSTTTRADGSGCADTFVDERCDDSNVCSDDYCRPSDALSFKTTGCLQEANTALCDDGDECTGPVDDPDQCADFECVPGGMVCPYFAGNVFAGQYYPAGNVVVTNSETHVLLRWDAGDSGWTTDVIHVYVGAVPPSKLSPGRFTKTVTMAAPVSQLSVAVPLPDACNMDGPVYFAFHMEAISGTGAPICILRNGKTTCSGVTETGWFKGDAQPPKTNNWGSYAQFDACCCAGFSHVDKFLSEDSSVEILFSMSSAKAAMSSPETELISAIAELLQIPTSAVQLVSYDSRRGSDLEDAVIRFYEVDGVSAGTLARELADLPASAFAPYGLEVDSLAVIPNVNDYVNVGGNLYSSFDSESSSAGVVFFGAMLSVLMLLL